jgi:hypothetical protein
MTTVVACRAALMDSDINPNNGANRASTPVRRAAERDDRSADSLVLAEQSLNAFLQASLCAA